MHIEDTVLPKLPKFEFAKYASGKNAAQWERIREQNQELVVHFQHAEAKKET